ncbi:hypothetical protein JCM24511_00016 [Saitozyma sp. JCM 24511]|nr:hypothetical protein JCM24511_00016 [Saitozyma sp. JCM 24511]
MRENDPSTHLQPIGSTSADPPVSRPTAGPSSHQIASLGSSTSREHPDSRGAVQPPSNTSKRTNSDKAPKRKKRSSVYESGGDGAGRGYRRASKACVRCRKHKLRCTGGDPCVRCTKFDFGCEFDQPSQVTPARGTPSGGARWDGVPDAGFQGLADHDGQTGGGRIVETLFNPPVNEVFTLPDAIPTRPVHQPSLTPTPEDGSAWALANILGPSQPVSMFDMQTTSQSASFDRSHLRISPTVTNQALVQRSSPGSHVGSHVFPNNTSFLSNASASSVLDVSPENLTTAMSASGREGELTEATQELREAPFKELLHQARICCIIWSSC